MEWLKQLNQDGNLTMDERCFLLSMLCSYDIDPEFYKANETEMIGLEQKGYIIRKGNYIFVLKGESHYATVAGE